MKNMFRDVGLAQPPIVMRMAMIHVSSTCEVRIVSVENTQRGELVVLQLEQQTMDLTVIACVLIPDVMQPRSNDRLCSDSPVR
jgi:hypothetical protein